MLNREQFQDAIAQEEQIRRMGQLNPDKGFVGNGFWWGSYPAYTDQRSGFLQNESYGPPNAPISPMGETASASEGSGVSAVGGMASN
jgi:hypothetical protein